MTTEKEITTNDMIEMIKECDCETCGLSENCNGVDLMNCYIQKKMVIKK